MQTVLITGADKGIGRALAEKFLAENFRVFGTTRDGQCPYSNDNLKILQLELTDSKSIEQAAKEISESGEKIEILINNAGVLLDEEETKVRTDMLRATLEVNLVGTIDFTERIVPLMKEGGHIVNISSQAGSIQDADNLHHSHTPLHYPAYKISKAALNMYTKTLALRMKSENLSVVVSSIHPGWVKTDMGGSDAPIPPSEAAEDIYKLAISRPASGLFWFKGKVFPW